jgi:hypothetical protein
VAGGEAIVGCDEAWEAENLGVVGRERQSKVQSAKCKVVDGRAGAKLGLIP